MAQSGHDATSAICPVSGANRTLAIAHQQLMMVPTDLLEPVFRGSKCGSGRRVVPKLYSHRTHQLRNVCFQR
jgi:hypothetical protein